MNLDLAIKKKRSFLFFHNFLLLNFFYLPPLLFLPVVVFVVVVVVVVVVAVVVVVVVVILVVVVMVVVVVVLAVVVVVVFFLLLLLLVQSTCLERARRDDGLGLGNLVFVVGIVLQIYRLFCRQHVAEFFRHRFTLFTSASGVCFQRILFRGSISGGSGVGAEGSHREGVVGRLVSVRHGGAFFSRPILFGHGQRRR